jgi:4-amino-4-deoxy-L-arabinose transferase-like glycosyltransferase
LNLDTTPVRRHSGSQTRAPGLTANRIALIFVVAFAAGIAIRLWRLGVSPAWQWDEAVYWRVSSNVQHHVLSEHSVYGLPWEPFLYQPPVFFLIEARWFDLVGASIYHARVLGVMCTAVMQVFLFGLIKRLHGLQVALFTLIPVIFDGWLLYIERVSYIENALMILVVLGFLLYARALDSSSAWPFFLAGLALGSAASFKQTGAYVVVAVLLCWLIVRRQHRGHLILFSGAILVIAAYLALMIVKYDTPGHQWFIQQSLVQVKRVLGLQQSGGTLTSPANALHLLTQQYKYFVPSLILAVAAIVLALRRTWHCYRARSWAPAQPNAVLYAWLVTGVVVFGASSLKFPQYFVLILLPGYCYFWTELARWDIDSWWKRFWPLAAAVIGTMSFLLTIPVFNVNALAEVQAYAADRIPASAIVVTEESIGDLISQRWCTVEKAAACVGHATYAITWQTYLQSSFSEGGTTFAGLMKGATAITSFSGAVGTATVWKLRITQ